MPRYFKESGATMKAAQLAKFLSDTLSSRGFKVDEVDDAMTYGGRPAWAIYYVHDDCKLQICWSARDGGIDFMFAPRAAPNTFGLADKSGTWRFMLLLSGAHDNLVTPGLDAGDSEVMRWLRSLFTVHFDSALQKLRQGQA